MKIRVRYTAQLRTALGRSEEDVELPGGGTLRSLLTYLAGRVESQATGHLVGKNGDPPSSLLVVVNDAAIPAHAAAATELQTGDTVILLPPIAGG